MTRLADAAGGGSVADVTGELRARSLVAELRTRGFFFLVYRGELAVLPSGRLGDDDAARVAELREAILALFRADDSAELFDPPAELAAWLDGLTQARRELALWVARQGAEVEGWPLADALAEVRRIWTAAEEGPGTGARE